VSTQSDAIDALRRGDHDVYVVDHLVGTHTGFDLLSWLKMTGLRLPIVFVSGPNDHGTGVTAVSAGASCYVVSSSIDSGLLEHSLRQAVEQTRALDRLNRAGIAVDTDTSTKTRLLFRIAERLREPAAAVLEVTGRSLEMPLPSSALESFGSIEDKVNVLLTLANDLNDLAVLEAGNLQFSTESFSLRGLVSRVIQTIGSTSGEDGPEISVELAPDVPDAVVGDPGRLRVVVINFVERVAERSRARRIRVKVSVGNRSPGAVVLRFEIEPEAMGSRLENSITQSTSPLGSNRDSSAVSAGGTFGIPVALEIVSRMGGTVTVDSNADFVPGIQFTIRLQVSDVGHESRPNPDDHGPMDGPILVIADSLEARRSLASSLGGASLPHLVVPSVEAWAGSGISTDNGEAMPSLVVIESADDSFAVCDEFSQIAPDGTPVVVVVASGQRGDAARCRERGVRGYLPRPLTSADLIDIVRSSMALTLAGDTTTLVTTHWLRDGRPSLHVLVVDDSTTNRFLLTRILEQRGHSTDTANDGSEAVEACRTSPFDVVLMDVIMPVMDGLEATRLIRGLESDQSPQPVIIGVSAFAEKGNIEQADEAGMDGFLAKPVQPEDLFAVIEQHRFAAVT
jgi:CheY-like chemotaxis protein